MPFSEGPPFKLELAEARPHAVLKSIDTPLTQVKTHAPTLEEAYLEVLERS